MRVSHGPHYQFSIKTLLSKKEGLRELRRLPWLSKKEGWREGGREEERQSLRGEERESTFSAHANAPWQSVRFSPSRSAYEELLISRFWRLGALRVWGEKTCGSGAHGLGLIGDMLPVAVFSSTNVLCQHLSGFIIDSLIPNIHFLHILKFETQTRPQRCLENSFLATGVPLSRFLPKSNFRNF